MTGLTDRTWNHRVPEMRQIHSNALHTEPPALRESGNAESKSLARAEQNHVDSAQLATVCKNRGSVGIVVLFRFGQTPGRQFGTGKPGLIAGLAEKQT